MKPAEYKALKFASGKPQHCWMCRCELTLGTATVDHLIAKSSKRASVSQKSQRTNYRLACLSCNSKRGNRRLTKDELKAARGFFRPDRSALISAVASTAQRNQPSKMDHPARSALLGAGRDIPGLWAHYDAQAREHQYPHPMYISEPNGAMALVAALQQAGMVDQLRSLRESDPIGVATYCAHYTTLACWRMTQGIYRFDPTLYSSLIDTDLAGDLPADVLLRLPEWCVYIETPGLQVATRSGGRSALIGAWARLDIEPDGTPTLVLGLHIDGLARIEHHHVPLHGSLLGAIEDVMQQWGYRSARVAGEIEGYTRPIINLLLFLCSGDDVSGAGKPGNPEPVKTRRDGMRRFAAAGQRSWDVGVRIGSALRRAYAAAEAGAGSAGDERSGPRPHIRRAHWHGYRVGPRKRDDGSDIPIHSRRLELRWLPPIAVALDDADQLPAVIRPVLQPAESV